MQYIVLNAGPILLATLAGFLVSLAYAWIAQGRLAGELRSDGWLALLALVAEGWLACILAGALILAPHQAGVWVMSLGSAVIIWIGFVLPALVVTLRWRGVAALPALADCALWLVVMLVQAVALQVVGLHRP